MGRGAPLGGDTLPFVASLLRTVSLAFRLVDAWIEQEPVAVVRQRLTFFRTFDLVTTFG